MILCIVATIFLIISTGSASPADFGVSVGSAEQYPFAVRLKVQTVDAKSKEVRFYGCGGILFTTSIVLTVAHCLFDKGEKVTSVKVTAGDTIHSPDNSKLQEVLAKGYRIHKDYKEKNKKLVGPDEKNVNDIAILWLSQHFEQTSAVKSAKLSAVQIRSDMIGYGLGFGKRREKSTSVELQKVQLDLISYDTCKYHYRYNNGPNTFCAFSHNGKAINTRGDSGSAVVYNGEVLGLLSFGAKAIDGKMPKGKPLCCTHIGKYAGFLTKNIKEGPPTELCPNPEGKFCALSIPKP